MKTLQNFIKENLLAESEDLKIIVDEFIRNNYTWTKGFTISNKPNKDGKYEVYCAGNMSVQNRNITELTNDLFIWKEIRGSFFCARCEKLTSLKGSPEKVGGTFDCMECSKLKSLEGAPKEVSFGFNCSSCESLTSLEGAPEKVEYFDCSYCDSLTKLKGAPKEVRLEFICNDCKKQFTENDINNVSLAGKIINK